jgi:hypothetical protein
MTPPDKLIDALKELKRTWAVCSPTSQETHSAVMALLEFIPEDYPNKESEAEKNGRLRAEIDALPLNTHPSKTLDT